MSLKWLEPYITIWINHCMALGYSEFLLRDISEDNANSNTVKKIITHIDKMGKITRKLMGIAKYETKDYLEAKIIEINKAAN